VVSNKRDFIQARKHRRDAEKEEKRLIRKRRRGPESEDDIMLPKKKSAKGVAKPGPDIRRSSPASKISQPTAKKAKTIFQSNRPEQPLWVKPSFGFASENLESPSSEELESFAFKPKTEPSEFGTKKPKSVLFNTPLITNGRSKYLLQDLKKVKSIIHAWTADVYKSSGDSFEPSEEEDMIERITSMLIDLRVWLREV